MGLDSKSSLKYIHICVQHPCSHSTPCKHHVRPTVRGVIVVHEEQSKSSVRTRKEYTEFVEQVRCFLKDLTYWVSPTWIESTCVVGQVCPKLPESVKSVPGRQQLRSACAFTQTLRERTSLLQLLHGTQSLCSSWPAVLPEILDECLHMAKASKLKFLSRKRKIWRCCNPYFFFSKLQCEELFLNWNSWIPAMTTMLKHVNRLTHDPCTTS